MTPTTAIGLTAQGVITQLDVPSISANIAIANQKAIADYTNLVNNWIEVYTNTSPALPKPQPPEPIRIKHVDTLTLTNLLIAWSNSLTNYSATIAPFDAASAFSLVDYPADPRIATTEAPPTAPTQPTDPVGADQGNGYFGVVPGDTNPAGTVFKDSRGTFVKFSMATPFGAEIAYIKIG